jgi:hypothetical protein
MGDPKPTVAEALVLDTDVNWRRRAALAFAEQGDARGAAELTAWWADEAPPHEGLDVQTAEVVLAAIARIRDVAAVPGLARSLDYVPLRPWIADAMGAIGDARARGPLLAALVGERNVGARTHEARALLALGTRTELRAPLARFAGMPDPMIDAVRLARDARILDSAAGGLSLDAPKQMVSGTVSVPVGVPLRLLAISASTVVTSLSGTAGERAVGEDHPVGDVHVVELDPTALPRLPLELHDSAGLLAVWVVARVAEAPTPPAVPLSDDAGRPEHHS